MTAGADLNPIANVGDLRKILADLPDDMPVRIHVGIDVAISEVDVDGDGLVLFPDDDAGISFVSTHWLRKEHPDYGH